MSSGSIPTLTGMTGLAASPAAGDREKLKATARQFEALFMRQMLAAARATDFGGDDLLGSSAMQTFRQMQDDHMADVTAQTGTLGLASIIEAQIARFLPETADVDTGKTDPKAA
ncbi:rod-binding protein [Novosphingobium colocasiae]|uniref:rod-binding protein n=1 Tax=Novosphingobium colocasiae TaxID=1256513 RepID=UPI0035AFDE66